MPRKKKEGGDEGQCADREWADRVKVALGFVEGGGAAVAERLGIDPGTVSKAHTQLQGSADTVFGISRVANVAPPRRLFDEQQYALLEELARVRREMIARVGPGVENIAWTLSGLLVQVFRDAASNALAGVPDVAPLELPPGAAGSSGGRKKRALKG